MNGLKGGLLIFGAYVLVAIGVGVILFKVFGTEPEVPNHKPQINACQRLATGMEELYLESDQDFTNYYDSVSNVLNNHISVDFFANELDTLMAYKDQRITDYQRLLDLYADECAGKDTSEVN